MTVPGLNKREISAAFEDTRAAPLVNDMTNDIQNVFDLIEAKIEEMQDVTENEPEESSLRIPETYEI